ncbi:hypothetical protein QIS74_08589 [Colletotrichum tabaci]|uniref:Duf521 domain protein n=1 Tax=Colletotrichum tabaci TaxID=1209068 RepID=A0AAV9T872_9PEZI
MDPRKSVLFLVGAAHVTGSARGTLMASDTELSMWGGVDPQTGEVIDRHHPLSGRFLCDTILAIPGGRGSCTGSGVMLETLLNGKGPRAVVFERREDILTLGVIIAQELFGRHIPVVTLKPTDFRLLLALDGQTVSVDGGNVCAETHDALDTPRQDVHPPIKVPTSHPEESKTAHHAEDQLDNLICGVRLSNRDRELLEGSHGNAARAAMRIVLRMASLLDAEELMDVSQVHVDGCLYTGPASLAFAEKLLGLGGKVAVPTTMNSISIDARRWRALGIDPVFGDVSARLADAYVQMGATPTFTCAPYQLESAPRKGDQVAWGESNAVIYANSVLGAKTMKYPDYLDIAVALTERAPRGGAHIDSNRLASVLIRVPRTGNAIDDSFYPLLGYFVGTQAVGDIPVVAGLEDGFYPTKDDLRAFGAAFATVSSAFMFHIVGVTPEAPTLEAVSAPNQELRCVDLDWRALEAYWARFNSAPVSQGVDLVSLGNPHFSLAEIRLLAELCRGRMKHQAVQVIVTCGRAVHGLASQAGLVGPLENFGVQFLTDTCWCMITEPIIPLQARTIMTNSGKYAHYGPGLTGRGFRFGSLAMCVEAACSGGINSEKPGWLQAALVSEVPR